MQLTGDIKTFEEELGSIRKGKGNEMGVLQIPKLALGNEGRERITFV